MEAAAETVKELSRTILPERPHQLCQSPDLKCGYPPDESSKHCEEWRDRRLQYMTYLSDADRGVIFTRGYYDFRPEPAPRPVPKEVNALARGGASKKLSLSDYKNKKTGANTPRSPPDPNSSHTSQKGADRASATPGSESRPGTQTTGKPGASKPPLPNATGTPQQEKSSAVDMSLPAKPPSLPPKPPSPESRKRPADVDDGSRPPKRQRPSDVGRTADDRSHTPRDDPGRRKAQDTGPSRLTSSSKEDRSSNSSSSLPNGRSVLKAATGASRTGSPPRSRGNSVNGARPTGLDSNQGTPKKSQSKSGLPPLLSPLRLPDGHKEDSERRVEKRRREEAPDSVKVMKSSKYQDAQPSAKRPRSPIPPLLSPTLPPEIEAELERTRKVSPGSPEDRPRDPESFSQSKKPSTEKPRDTAPAKSSKGLLVTMRIPKSLRPKFKLLMKLSPRKEPLRSDRPPSGTALAHSGSGDKRPVADRSLEPTAMKKPRSSDVYTAGKGPMPPSTPSKKGSTAMSRVSSNNSMAPTPGEAMAATPTVPDRSTHPLSKMSETKDLKALRDRAEQLRKLGRDLKHKGQADFKTHNDPNASTNGAGRHGDTRTKTGVAVYLEGIATFMMMFHLQDVSRSATNKPRDASIWTGVFPLIDVLQGELRRSESKRRLAPLHAVSLALQAISWDQFAKSWATNENARDRVTVEQLLKSERERERIWPLFRDANDSVDKNLRIEVFPWTTVEEVVDSTLRVLRRWCADEAVDWTPELHLREHGVKTAVLS